MCHVDLTRQLSSESTSSDETQKGSPLPKMQEMLDTDEEQTINIDTQELSEPTGIVGFTE